MVWDPKVQAVLLFGGSNGTAYHNDTWKFTLSQGWTELHLSVAPPARRAAGMTYDGATGEVILWGGHDSLPGTGAHNQSDYVMLNDTWSFYGGRWRNVSTVIGPAPAAEPTLVYDPLISAVVEFDGYTQNLTATTHAYHAQNQTWVYASGRWTPLALSVMPWPRDGAAAAFDPYAGGVVIYGGQDEGTPGECLMNDTWLLSGSTVAALHWTELPTAAGATPPLMDSSMAVYDAAAGRLFMFGGTGSSKGVCGGIPSMIWFSGTWEFDY